MCIRDSVEDVNTIHGHEYHVITKDVHGPLGYRPHGVVNAMPVSYTHLDVYKRQPVSRRVLLPAWGV